MFSNWWLWLWIVLRDSWLMKVFLVLFYYHCQRFSPFSSLKVLRGSHLSPLSKVLTSGTLCQRKLSTSNNDSTMQLYSLLLFKAASPSCCSEIYCTSSRNRCVGLLVICLLCLVNLGSSLIFGHSRSVL